MATDPVDRIRAFDNMTRLALDLPQALPRLAALPPSPEAPYLTVSLDWRPLGSQPGRRTEPEPQRSEFQDKWAAAGTPRRPGRQFLENELPTTLKRFPEHSPARKSLREDARRVMEFLDQELDPAAHGVVIIACNHAGIFEAVPLDVPVANEVSVGPIPSLLRLVQAAEDYPAYAVVVADQRESVVWLFERQVWERSVSVEADDYPRHQQQGGWSQRRYQARAGERIEHVAKAIAEETKRAFEDYEEGIDYLILAAAEPMLSAVQAELHESVASRVIGQIQLPANASVTQVLAEAQPLVEAAERKRELEAVQTVRDEVGANGKGVAGPEATLTALQTGQVLKLVMNDDFRSAGWADYSLSLFGTGLVPSQHPAGGDVANIVPTSLHDECIRLAIQQGAEIEIVRTMPPINSAELVNIPDAGQGPPRTEAARLLDEIGGIGAVLRFALEQNRPTATM
ncbi:MAG TPA: Vms1/Ankzf1 family peptidyl-tRNA hydrolase [Thermomicrobiales bacterium]